MQQDKHRFRGSTNVREDKCVYSENYYIEILQLNRMCMETYQCDTHVRGDAHVSGDVCLKTHVVLHIQENTYVFGDTSVGTRVCGETPRICVETQMCMETTHLCVWKRQCAGRHNRRQSYVWGEDTEYMCGRHKRIYMIINFIVMSITMLCAHKQIPHKYTSLQNTMLSTGEWA